MKNEEFATATSCAVIINYVFKIMKIKNIIAFAAVGIMLTGCGLYNKYEQGEETKTKTEGLLPSLYGEAGANSSLFNHQSSLSDMSWREFFTDPLLQQLIEQVLANNTNLNSARIAVEKSEASLKAAKMAYLPSLRAGLCAACLRWAPLTPTTP